MLRKWLLIGLVVTLLVSFVAVTSCGESESDVEVTAGKYVNQDGSGNYMKIKADGTFYSYKDGMIAVGEWDVDGNVIIFYKKDESGNMVSAGGAVVEDNIIKDPDGADLVWKDTDEVEVTAGKYVNQDNASDYLKIEADGTYSIYQGEMVNDGEWDVTVNGNIIIFFEKDDSGNIVPVRGAVVEGNRITEAGSTVWVLEE